MSKTVHLSYTYLKLCETQFNNAGKSFSRIPIVTKECLREVQSVMYHFATRWHYVH